VFQQYSRELHAGSEPWFSELMVIPTLVRDWGGQRGQGEGESIADLRANVDFMSLVTQ